MSTLSSSPIESPSHEPIGLVAIDLDGTLLRTDKRLSRKTVEAIIETTKKGVHVVLATARPPRSTREIHELLRLETLSVHYNGALIHDHPSRTHVFHQPLPAGVAQQLVKVARRVDPRVIVSLEILDKWYTDHLDERFLTETSKVFTPDFIGPLEAFMHVPVTKLQLLGPPDRIAKVRDTLVRKFKGHVSMLMCDPYLIQIIHPEADKAAAVAMVAEQYKIPRERVLAIGDAPNDVGMIRWAGLGAVVANAWPELRAIADVVLPSNDDEGVRHALRQYVLDRV